MVALQMTPPRDWISQESMKQKDCDAVLQMATLPSPIQHINLLLSGLQNPTLNWFMSLAIMNSTLD